MTSVDNPNSCIICSNNETPEENPTNGYIRQKCRDCGTYNIFGRSRIVRQKGFDAIGEDELPIKLKLIGWICDQNRNGVVPTLDDKTIDLISSRKIPSFVERSNRLLFEMVERDKSLFGMMGQPHDKNNERFLAVTYSHPLKNEIPQLVNLLVKRGWIGFSDSTQYSFRVLPEGYVAHEELTSKRDSESGKCFVAMSFSDSLKETYEKGFASGIVSAGYNPIRMDREEYINRIDDEIISNINTSRFIVADFTGHKGGVYYEAGYAMGKDIPVIWTCRKTDFDKLHFDIRQYNCIEWETPDGLSKKLRDRIIATIGEGPLKN